jgi:ribosomal protein S18 acetylase RimI-like enzyme
MPEYRSSGIGTALVRDLIAEARKSAVPLTCSVATNNPGSLRFHQRLGFQIVSEDPMYYEMEYRVGS